jgi:hypothetical protein
MIVRGIGSPERPDPLTIMVLAVRLPSTALPLAARFIASRGDT